MIGVDDVEGGVCEALPDEVVAGLEVRIAGRKELASSTAGLEFIVSDVVRWPVGSVMRVAFVDGIPTFYGEVATATKQITDVANPTLDFGHNSTGTDQGWCTSDAELTAEIRVSFDEPGCWSLLGTDCNDPTIPPLGPLGGESGQRSLNLCGFTADKLSGWDGRVRYEHVHALAFQHERENIWGPCQADFRWENDPGYVPTTIASGVLVADAQARRPGIYAFFAGPPNHGSRANVDHNLNTVDHPDPVAGPFEAASTGAGVDLSKNDQCASELLYPASEAPADALAEQRVQALEHLGAGEEAVGGGDHPSAHVTCLVEPPSLQSAPFS